MYSFLFVYCCAGAGNQKLGVINLAGGTTQRLGSGISFKGLSDVVLGYDDATVLYALDGTNNLIYAINTTSGAQERTYGQGILKGPKGLAVSSNNVLYVADSGNLLWADLINR